MSQMIGQKRHFESDTIKMSPEDLVNKFRSKQDIYNYLTFQGKIYDHSQNYFVGLFLPSIQNTRIDFLRNIVNEQKKALKLSQVKSYGMPKFPELSIKNLMEIVKGDADVMLYIPDSDKQGQKARIE